MLFRTTALLAAAAALQSADVADACEGRDDCTNVDYGSCGNACCKLSVDFPNHTTEEVRDALLGAFDGTDGRYTPQMTAEGTLGFGDLRPFNASADFIGQAWHLTKNEMYNDTVNFALYANDGENKGTTATAFSISQIAGAFGDSGQNYYNLVALLEEAFEDDSAYSVSHPDGSCPEAAVSPVAADDLTCPASSPGCYSDEDCRALGNGCTTCLVDAAGRLGCH